MCGSSTLQIKYQNKNEYRMQKLGCLLSLDLFLRYNGTWVRHSRKCLNVYPVNNRCNFLLLNTVCILSSLRSLSSDNTFNVSLASFAISCFKTRATVSSNNVFEISPSTFFWITSSSSLKTSVNYVVLVLIERTVKTKSSRHLPVQS